MILLAFYSNYYFKYFCTFKQEMPTIELAKRAAALEACRVLHGAKEIDDYMVPVGKDGLRTWVRNKINRKSFSPAPIEEVPPKATSEETVADQKLEVSGLGKSPLEPLPTKPDESNSNNLVESPKKQVI